MYKFLTKNGQLIAFGLGLFIVLIFLGIVFGGLEEFNMIEEDKQNQSNLFNFGLTAVLILTVVCALAMVAFGIIQVATNLKGSLKGLIGLGVILIVFFIAYSSGAGAEEVGAVKASMDKAGIDAVGADWRKGFISGGIITTLALGALAVLSFVGSEILNFFK